MDDARTKQQAVCGEEALDLLNCVTQSPYDHDKCVSLLNALRECVVKKKVKKFSLDDHGKQKTNQVTKEA